MSDWMIEYAIFFSWAATRAESDVYDCLLPLLYRDLNYVIVVGPTCINVTCKNNQCCPVSSTQHYVLWWYGWRDPCLLCPGREAEYCNQFVCLSVCPQVYLWNHWTDFVDSFLQILCGRGSALLWQHCDTGSPPEADDEQSSYQHHSINLFAIFQETT